MYDRSWIEGLPLNRLTSLDADVARALANFNGHLLSLAGLTTLDLPDSVAIAKALASRKGQLSRPNLAKIFSNTLAALLEKEDVHIPFIEQTRQPSP
jgi:hypothetical protein